MQDRRLWKPEGGPEGGHPQSRRLPGAARGVATPSGRLGQGATPQVPLSPIFTSRSENPREQPRYAISSTIPLLPRFRLGIARRSCPGTLPEGGLTSGGLSITMIASGMCRE